MQSEGDMPIITQALELRFWRMHRHDQIGDLRLISVERDDEGGTVRVLIWGMTWTRLSELAAAGLAG